MTALAMSYRKWLMAFIFTFVLAGMASALEFGVHLGDGPETFPWRIPLARAIRAHVVPLEFRWDEVEPTPGRFAWTSFDTAVDIARVFEVQVVGVLHYPAELPPLARTSRPTWPSAHVDDWNYFVQRVVTRYADVIDDWIVVRGRTAGQDPLLAATQASADAELVQLTADAMKRADADARLFAAVPGADLRWMSVYIAHGGLSVVDGLALDINRWPVSPEGLAQVVGDVTAMAEEAGDAPALWVWRFGYPTHVGVSETAPRRRGVSRHAQAAFVVRTHAVLASAGVTTVLWDELVDRGRDVPDARANFGLYENLGRGKPAAFAYATMTRMLEGLRYEPPALAGSPVADEPSGPAVSSGPNALANPELAAPNVLPAPATTPLFDAEAVLASAEEERVVVHAHRFAGDGRTVFIVWTSPGPGRSDANVLESLDGQPIRLYDMFGERVDDLPLGPEPVYIETLTEF